MSNDFRKRLSFSGSDNHTSSQRENWQAALALLPEIAAAEISQQQLSQQKISPLLANLPSLPASIDKKSYLEWVLTEDSNPNCVLLVPYFVDGESRYRVPSLSHLLSHLTLSEFEQSWVMFFAEHFYHEEAKVILDEAEIINAILWALGAAERLRLASDNMPLAIAPPLRLQVRLSHSDEWALWALDPELMTDMGELIAPQDLDFATNSGLIIYDGNLFPLPHGAAWIVQFLASRAWFIAKENLGEALYQLSHRIQDADFLHHLAEVQCMQKTPLPVVYLRAKHFDNQAPVNFYLAFRYGDCEVFSLWHGQDEANIPLGFEAHDESWIFYFRDLAQENAAELLIKNEAGMSFNANKRAWTVHVSALWQLIHVLLGKRWEVWAEKHKIEELSSFGIGAESGLGWFDLCPYDTNARQVIDPLQLIKYLKRKSLFIQLGHDRIC